MTKNPIVKVGLAVILIGLLIFFGIPRRAVFHDWLVGAAKPLLTVASVTRGFLLPKEELRAILEENQKLKAENAELEILRSSNETLRAALSIEREKNTDLLLAPVFHYGREAGKEFLLTDRGKESGISVGQVAVDHNGLLVGIVREVGDRFSRIEVASNPGETFEVELIPLRVKALAEGIGNRTLVLDLLPVEAPIQRGDYLVLLGLGGDGGRHYGIAMGEMVSLKKNGSSAFKKGRATLLAKPELLREVFLIMSS